MKQTLFARTKMEKKLKGQKRKKKIERTKSKNKNAKLQGRKIYLNLNLK